MNRWIRRERDTSGMPTVADIIAGVALAAAMPVCWILLEVIQVLAHPAVMQ